MENNQSVKRCLCGKEIQPPRTTYCSEKCHRQATRKKRSSTSLKPMTKTPSKSESSKDTAKKLDHQKYATHASATPAAKHLATHTPATPTTKKHATHASTTPTAKHPATHTPATPTTAKKTVANKQNKQRKATVSLPKSVPFASSVALPLPPRKEQPLLMPLGRNMPAKMALLDAIYCAHGLGYTALQLFLSDPDSWHAPLLPPPLLLSVAQALSEVQFSCVVVHAPFVIDLASHKENVWINSVLLLRTILQQARLIGASDVVVHLNNYKRSFDPVSDQQLEHIVKGITYSLSDGPNVPFSSVRLLLENGCNPHFSPGSRIEELGRVFHALRPEYQAQVRICLDTAHCWSAGYDISNQMTQFLHIIERFIGLTHLQVLHLNDAKYKLGSTKDEHAQWGTGQISAAGVHGIQSFLQDSRLAHIALIMETPLLKDEKGQLDWEQEKRHVALVKRMLLAP